jgi:hypothetical protein
MKYLKDVIMIDTIKIVIPYTSRPYWIEKARLYQSIDATKGTFKATANPSNAYKKMGIYQPRLTYTERPSGKYGNLAYELAIELSLPKLMHGNNFTELIDADFDAIVKKLSETLRQTYSVWVLPHILEQASVRKIDYSKNIVFTDRTPVSVIIGNIRTADISKTYDVQNTDFKNGGHIYHIHTNSLDIAFYDKVADLHQEKISPKRSYEKDGYVQMDLLEELEKKKKVSVARMEVRINGLVKLRQELKAIGIENNTTFKELFSADISKKILLRHWGNVFDKIPKIPLDSDTPESLFINITKANPALTLTQAMAVAHYQEMLKYNDERYIRNIAEGLFNPSQYKRFKQKGREPPSPTQLKTLLYVTGMLTAMKPVSIVDYKF